MSPRLTRATRPEATFQEDVYFENLESQRALIEDMLQMGRGEAGVLDKKLDPDLLRLVGQVIALLHDPDYRDQAMQKLVSITHPDLPIAILRLAFRVTSDRASDILIEKLVELAKSPGHRTAQEAIREATGSQVRRISQLADEAFLQVAATADLLQVAGDQQRSPLIRVRAAQRLVEQDLEIQVVPVAVDLFAAWAHDPNYRDALRKLAHSFGRFSQLDLQIQIDQVVDPLMDALREYERDINKRSCLANAVACLPEATVEFCRALGSYDLTGLWIPLALRECAKKTPDATVLMLQWIADGQVEDRFRRELALKMRHQGVRLPPADILEKLVDRAMEYVEDSMSWPDAQEQIRQVLRSLQCERVHRSPDEVYEEILDQLAQRATVDDDLIWEFRNTRGGFSMLQGHLRKMSDEELRLLLDIVYHERFSGALAERIRLLVAAFARLDTAGQRRGMEILFLLGQRCPSDSRDRKQVHDFMVKKVDDPVLGDLALRYYRELGTTAEPV